MASTSEAAVSPVSLIGVIASDLFLWTPIVAFDVSAGYIVWRFPVAQEPRGLLWLANLTSTWRWIVTH